MRIAYTGAVLIYFVYCTHEALATYKIVKMLKSFSLLPVQDFKCVSMNKLNTAVCPCIELL